MKVWLLRHGEAEAQAVNDSERRLTPHGRDEVEAVSAVLIGRPLIAIYASPYVRAQESAAIVKRITACPGDLITVPWLTPETSPKMAFEQMSHEDDRDVLFVAHQPLLGALSALLAHGETSRPFALSTAALVELEGASILAGDMSLKAIH